MFSCLQESSTKTQNCLQGTAWRNTNRRGENRWKTNVFTSPKQQLLIKLRRTQLIFSGKEQLEGLNLLPHFKARGALLFPSPRAESHLEVNSWEFIYTEWEDGDLTGLKLMLKMSGPYTNACGCSCPQESGREQQLILSPGSQGW